MAIINFNYSRAISQAGQIEEIAQEMRSLADRDLQNGLEELSACWKGEASNQFVAYCGTTQNDLRAEASKLQDLARRIREIARILREAEERAKAQMQSASSSTGSGGGFSGGGAGGFGGGGSGGKGF